MTHEPELDAAAYLAGEMSEDERQRFDEHLLECDECWHEVEAGRGGLAAVESARELAPSHLRAAIRRALASGPASRASRRGRLIAVAAALVVVLGAGATIFASLRPSEPAAIAAAVTGYSESRLPGAAMPKEPAPDLSALRMSNVGAGAGRLDDIPVTAYAYRDSQGRRLLVYVSPIAFPMPKGGRPLDGIEGPWMAHSDGIAVLCARDPHELLILGEDDKLVHDAAVALDVM